MPEQHRMILHYTDSNGVDTFVCPQCGYCVMIQWPPHYKQTVLQFGDESALHHASKGGLEIGADVYKTEWSRD